jgi:hypothetical protein
MKLVALALAAALLPTCLANVSANSVREVDTYGVLVSVKGFDAGDGDRGYTSIGYNSSTSRTYDSTQRVCIGLKEHQDIVITVYTADSRPRQGGLVTGSWVNKFSADINQVLTISSTYYQDGGFMQVDTAPPAKPGSDFLLTLRDYSYFGLNYSYHGLC